MRRLWAPRLRASPGLVGGGLGGAMAAACRGAAEAGGTTLGILPGDDRATANALVTVAGRPRLSAPVA
jgi:uncharacterized protein (TIGR00725 family)